jgi:ABC-type bacteriocin/lantibiotic exporter with double-glycine peptidase domain
MPWHAALMLLAVVADEPDPTRSSDPRCGSRCLYVALKGLGFSVKDLAELEERLGAPPVDGYTLAQLDSGARSYGAQTLGVETTIDNLRLRKPPFACIAHLTHDHFVLISDVNEASATVGDPPHMRSVPLDTLRVVWDRKSLLIAPGPLVREEDLPRPPGWGLWQAAAAGIVIACGVAFAISHARRRRA